MNILDSHTEGENLLELKPNRSWCGQVECEKEYLGPNRKGSSSPKKLEIIHGFINISKGLLCATH